MAFLSFLQLGVLVTFFLQVQCSTAAVQKRGKCATADPGASFLNELQRLKSDESLSDPESVARLSPIEIDTWFHVVSTDSEANLVTPSMLQAQFSILQTAYESTGIAYRLRGVTHNINDTWARNEDDLGMKLALRQGSYQTLNVYFQTDLQAIPGQEARAVGIRDTNALSDLTTSVLGFCTLPDPTVNATSLAADYVKDGCNVLAQTMPGGPLDLYNRGGTAIHEIGHWNGLLHTFQGESCSPDDPGDYISDTPQQKTPTSGCPSRKDSCPDAPGLDAVHDFMDYSNDACYERFTPGQGTRMRSMWATMRAGK